MRDKEVLNVQGEREEEGRQGKRRRKGKRGGIG